MNTSLNTGFVWGFNPCTSEITLHTRIPGFQRSWVPCWSSFQAKESWTTSTSTGKQEFWDSNSSTKSYTDHLLIKIKLKLIMVFNINIKLIWLEIEWV